MSKRTPQRKKEFVWEILPDTSKRFLWCDEKYLERIKALEGVASASADRFQPCCTISFDPRYDIEDVRAAIETVITGVPDAQEEV